jgi:NitT/TauT family transport system ATP-binding protein
MGETMPIIEVRGLNKSYAAQNEGSVHALEDINFQVARGEFVCIVGPSGCGKSTLLKILAGVETITSGSVLLHGVAPDTAGIDIGLVFQAPVLLPWRTVLQNTLLPAEVLDLDKRQATERAKQLIRLVGLEKFENSYPHELSGGMQQRCSIARALLHDPSVLLMDEPFGALDAMTRDTMNLELQKIAAASGKTILLITHSIPEAVFLADRVIVMSPRPGRIIDEVICDFPRPRGLSAMSTPEFGDAVSRIRERFALPAEVSHNY